MTVGAALQSDDSGKKDPGMVEAFVKNAKAAM